MKQQYLSDRRPSALTAPRRLGLVLAAVLLTGLLGACIPDFFVDQGYVLSGAIDRDASFIVDNSLDVYINGVVVESRDSDGREPTAPIYIQANQGDELVLRVRNRDLGSPCGLDRIYLRDAFGNSITATDGFSRVVCDTGLAFTSRTLTIPF